MTELLYTREFDAAHQLPNHPGKCKNLHGHRWKIEFHISGDVNPETGMLVDFGELKEVIDSLDHGYINDVVENPTAENIAKWFLDQLVGKYDNVSEINVAVWEGPNSKIEEYWMDPMLFGECDCCSISSGD